MSVWFCLSLCVRAYSACLYVCGVCRLWGGIADADLNMLPTPSLLQRKKNNQSIEQKSMVEITKSKSSHRNKPPRPNDFACRLQNTGLGQ